MEHVYDTVDVGIKLKQKIFEHAFQLKPSQYQKDGFLKILSDALYDVDNVLEIVENNFLIIGGIAIKLPERLSLYLLSAGS